MQPPLHGFNDPDSELGAVDDGVELDAEQAATATRSTTRTGLMHLDLANLCARPATNMRPHFTGVREPRCADQGVPFTVRRVTSRADGIRLRLQIPPLPRVTIGHSSLSSLRSAGPRWQWRPGCPAAIALSAFTTARPSSDEPSWRDALQSNALAWRRPCQRRACVVPRDALRRRG